MGNYHRDVLGGGKLLYISKHTDEQVEQGVLYVKIVLFEVEFAAVLLKVRVDFQNS